MSLGQMRSTMAVVSRRRVFAGAVISLVLLAFFWYRDVVTATDKVRHHEEQLGRACKLSFEHVRQHRATGGWGLGQSGG